MMPRLASLPSTTPAMTPSRQFDPPRGRDLSHSWPIERRCASGPRRAVAAVARRSYGAAGLRQGDGTMMRCPTRLGFGVAAFALIGLATAARPASAENGTVQLASHRAIYDLKLAEARGRRQLSAVQGRIVYDFSGSSCEGYALQFRQVTELDNGEGKVVVSDLRSATWEEGAAKTYR